MSRPSAALPIGAWYGDREITLEFPAGWDVHVLGPAEVPAIDDAAVEHAFEQPVDMDSLTDVVRGRRTAAIAVDDLTRPTPIHRVLPALLRVLREGGIPESGIRFVLGTAAHRPMDASEIDRKLGPGIRDRFPVFQHDFLDRGLCDLGWIDGGPVRLNRHFVEADVRICVGGVIPHNETGFGGGSKMVVPGLAGRETIAHFHGALPPRLAGVLEPAPSVRDRRVWSEAVARHIGVSFVVGCVINGRRELAGLHVGDLVGAHRAAALRARDIGRTPIPRDLAETCDVVVVNAYPLDTDPIQMGKSLNLARKLSARSTVVVNAASDGIFYHGMGMGSGVQPRRLLANLPRLIASPRRQWTWLRSLVGGVRRPLLAARLSYFTLNDLGFAAYGAADGQLPLDVPISEPPPERADPLLLSEHFPTWGFHRKYRGGRLYRRWNDLAQCLARRHEHGRVLVFPCAPLQLPEIEAS